MLPCALARGIAALTSAGSVVRRVRRAPGLSSVSAHGRGSKRAFSSWTAGGHGEHDPDSDSDLTLDTEWSVVDADAQDVQEDVEARQAADAAQAAALAGDATPHPAARGAEFEFLSVTSAAREVDPLRALRDQEAAQVQLPLSADGHRRQLHLRLKRRGARSVACRKHASAPA